MKHSTNKIRTTHCGRLPTPPGFEEMAFRLARGEASDEEVRAKMMPVVTETVKHQVDIGIDCVGDGEY